MKNMYEPATLNEVVQRINKLQPTSQRQWGKMEVAQMMAHCTAALQAATGEKFPPRLLIGKLLGGFMKSMFSNEKPFGKNGPTDKSFLITDQREFETEKLKLIEMVSRFAKGGPEKCTTHPHSFFGKLTAKEWATGMYKHLDHHLRQFGV